MFDPYAQMMNPWNTQPYGCALQQPFPFQTNSGFGWQSPYAGLQGQIAPQAWYGNPMGQPGPLSNPIAQQLVQQIPQLVQNAHRIAQQVPQLVQQLPQLIQQNPQLVQQAPQLQQVPQLLQQAAILAQQIPHVLQALWSPHMQGAAFGIGPVPGSPGFRPYAYGPAVFA